MSIFGEIMLLFIVVGLFYISYEIHKFSNKQVEIYNHSKKLREGNQNE